MAWTTLPKSKSQKSAEKWHEAKKKCQAQRKYHERLDKLQTLQTQVLSTTELLEMILLHLPMKDLLLAQRVCTKWKAVIDQSRDLQKALFLRPATSNVAFYHPGVPFDSYLDSSSSIRPGFFYLCPPESAHLRCVDRFERRRNALRGQASSANSTFNSSVEQVKRDRQALRDVVSRTPVFVNPLLLSKFPWYRYLFDTKYDLWSTGDGRKTLQLPRLAKRKEASWRRMLLTQPPLAAITMRSNSTTYWNFTRERDLSKRLKMEKLLASIRTVWVFQTKIHDASQFETWQDGGDLKKIKILKTIEEEEKEECLAKEASDSYWSSLMDGLESWTQDM